MTKNGRLKNQKTTQRKNEEPKATRNAKQSGATQPQPRLQPHAAQRSSPLHTFDYTPLSIPIAAQKQSVTDMLHTSNAPETQEGPLSRAFLLLFVQCFLCLML